MGARGWVWNPFALADRIKKLVLKLYVTTALYIRKNVIHALATARLIAGLFSF